MIHITVINYVLLKQRGKVVYCVQDIPKNSKIRAKETFIKRAHLELFMYQIRRRRVAATMFQFQVNLLFIAIGKEEGIQLVTDSQVCVV